MSAVAAAYRAVNPETVRAVTETNDQAYRDAVAAAYVFARAHGFEEVIGGSDGFGFRVTGFAKPTGDVEPGWRIDTKRKVRGWHVPAKRAPEGKALAEAMKPLSIRYAPTPGLPPMVSSMTDDQGRGWFMTPVVQRHGGDVFAVFAHEVAHEDRIEGEHWVRVPLSVYYAAVEAAAAAEVDA